MIILHCLILAASLVAADASAAGPASQPSGVVAQLYVWTQHYNQRRERLDDNLDEVFATTKRAGYDAVQGFLNAYDTPASAEVFAAKLKQHELVMPIAYVGGPMHTRPDGQATVDQILRQAEIGAHHGLKVVVLNPNPVGREKTDDELAIQAENLNLLGRLLRSRGLALAIHSHAPEMRSGAREWYHVLQHTKPENVSICLDLHWVLRGGQDPYRLLADAGRRVIDLHLRNSRGGVWAEALADGEIDYSRVADILKHIGYCGTYTVELAYEAKTEPARTIEENLRLSRRYVDLVFLSQ